LLCHLTYTQKLIQGWLRPTIDIRDSTRAHCPQTGLKVE
jgi:hypothetical protein